MQMARKLMIISSLIHLRLDFGAATVILYEFQFMPTFYFSRKYEKNQK